MHPYIDIHLRSDPEFPAHVLMAALYAKLHRALVQARSSTIGVSFPGYVDQPPGLGGTLRLFGPLDDLGRLMDSPWLQGMRDHTLVQAPAPVPASARHRALRRVQAKSSPERLRRRQMKRHGLTASEAQARIPDHAAEKLSLPFIELASGSTGQTFRLFLRLGPETETASDGAFNAYGLSSTATLPWF